MATVPGEKRQARPRRDVPAPVSRDLKRFLTGAFHSVRAAVQCDFISVLYRSTGTGLVYEVDSRGRTYSPAFMRRYAELTPASQLAIARPGVKILPSRLGLDLPDHELRASAFYREVMAVQGWRHAVALCFWGQPMSAFPRLVVTANRKEGRSDFSEADLRALRRAHRVLDGWVSDLLDKVNARAALSVGARTFDGARLGTIVLDWRLRVTIANSAGRRLLAVWNAGVPTGTRDTKRVPDDLANACRTLDEGWRSSLCGNADASAAHAKLTCPGPSGLSAVVMMQKPDNDGLAEPTFVIELQQREEPPLATDEGLRRALLSTLTPRERQVVSALQRGLSNKEIAEHLGKSVEAVKFLLHRIYRRTGIANRTHLVLTTRHEAVRRD